MGVTSSCLSCFLDFLRRLRIGNIDRNPVDLDVFIRGDEDILAPVDDAGFDHVAVLGGDGDLHLGGGDLELPGLDEVFRVQGGIFAVLPAALGLEDLADGELQRFGVVALSLCS